jgi:hypothetical protein
VLKSNLVMSLLQDVVITRCRYYKIGVKVGVANRTAEKPSLSEVKWRALPRCGAIVRALGE